MNAMESARSLTTLLIVEDQLIVAMALKNELERSGYRVLDLVMRHQQALDLARHTKPDLALVNIDLSDGDDGVALASDLKALDVPSVFISGQPKRARLANQVGIASMPKPYRASDMVEVVDYLIRRLGGDHSQIAPPGLEVFTPQPGQPPTITVVR
jgi:DNA-binding response OmpR family regulator